MDRVYFTIADFPVRFFELVIAAGAVMALVLCGVLVVLVRQSRARAEVEEAAAAQRAQLEQALALVQQSHAQQLADRDRQIIELKQDLREERQQVGQARMDQSDMSARYARLETQLEEHRRQSEAAEARFVALRQQMTDQFKALAGDVMKVQSETFTRQNREQVDTLLKPLSDKIVEFQTGLLRDRAAMTEQIKALAASNLMITTEAGNLTRALKGNTQAQGAWGEMILETILERSGLRQGEQYRTQRSHAAGDSGRVRTDVEILMPNDDVLVIDSKVSLTAFEAFTNAGDEAERAQQISAHVASLRGHIKTLGGKSYQRHAGSSLDYVMMFVPIEAALAAAVTHDPRLVEYGFANGVMLTTPTTLMTVLRTVRNVWDIEKRHENAEEIANRAGALYDKVAGFLASMDMVGKSLDRAQGAFTDARGQLQSGRGNIVRQIEMLRELGAKSTKTLPAGWDGEAGDEPPQTSKTDDGPPMLLRMFDGD